MRNLFISLQGERASAVTRILAFHQCDPGSVSWHPCFGDIWELQHATFLSHGQRPEVGWFSHYLIYLVKYISLVGTRPDYNNSMMAQDSLLHRHSGITYTNNEYV